MNEELKGSDGSKIGTIGQVHLDDETGRPEWVTVSPGMLSSKESFVPLAQAVLSGEFVTVPYDIDKVKGAPEVDVEAGHVSEEEEADLYRYYGLDYSHPTSKSGLPAAGDGHDSKRPGSGEAMTRSEKQVNVGVEKRESGKARLRKYVVTEQVTQTVPVSHEEIRVEREPITEVDRNKVIGGSDIREEEHEVTLHEDRVVVTKETVPVEKVKMSTEDVTEQQKVSEEVRKEKIETEGL